MTINDGKYTEAELALLTDEEREGLLEDDGSDEDEEEDGADGGDDAAAAADQGQKPEADDGDDAAEAQRVADAAKAAADEEAAAAAKAAEAAADQTVAAGDEEKATEEHSVVRLEDPNAVKAQIAKVNEQLDELAKQFDDGDLGAQEYRQKTAALQEQKEDLVVQRAKAETRLETALDTWRDQVKTFTGSNPQYAKGGILYDVLDRKVRELQVNAANPLDPKLLAKAHEEIERALGRPPKTDPKVDPKADPKAKRPAPPPTLATIPASDITEADDGSEFSHLDKLLERDSLTFEAEFKKLTPEQQDRYLAQ